MEFKINLFKMILIIFFVCLNIFFCSCSRQTTVDSSTDFDVLIFTQRLPQTVCYAWKENCSSNTCLSTDEEWTVHGIWPAQYHKIAPIYCNESMVFNLTELATIEDKLEEKWVTVENGTTHDSFWEHEWSKHGTCSAVLPQLNTQLKYFEKGLELLDEYDMKNILGQVNILPGNNYTAQEILKGVGNVLGKTCQVDCFSSEKQNVTYLSEIRICFDKSLNFIDCDGIFDFPTNCPLTGNIIYPKNPLNQHYDIQVLV